MNTAVIFQVEGLGVPVQVPSQRNRDGYEVRWSSDPDAPVTAPVHAIIGEKPMQRFLALAIDRRFREANLISIVPVKLNAQQLAEWQSNPSNPAVAISRDTAIASGVDEAAWNFVRVALVVSGSSQRGPRMDELEWYGSREQHAEGMHLREAYEHCKANNISSPTIFHHNQSAEIMDAADFLQTFRRQLKPSLRAAHEMAASLDEYVSNLDVESIHPERAKKYLEDIKKATAHKLAQTQADREDMAATNIRGAQEPDAPAAESAAKAAPTHFDYEYEDEPVRPRGPRLH